MSSKRDHDEELVIIFRGQEYRIPIHWRTYAEIKRKYGKSADGFFDFTSEHAWVSHESNKRKSLDHELEHALTEWRQKVWDGE